MAFSITPYVSRRSARVKCDTTVFGQCKTYGRTVVGTLTHSIAAQASAPALGAVLVPSSAAITNRGTIARIAIDA